MNTSNFDELTRAMATNSISRRGAIKGIAASALGGVLALGGVGNALPRANRVFPQTARSAQGDCMVVLSLAQAIPVVFV